MKVLNEYPTHHYMSEYAKTGFYCPLCGARDVWREQGAGDYYMGSDHVCTACGSQSFLDGSHECANEVRYMNIVEQLRTGVTMEPKTERGK